MVQELQDSRKEKPVESEEHSNEPTDDVPLIKPKKPRTPAQMEALAKAKEKARINAEERKKQREQEEKARKEEEEKLILAKAISIKKKEIKRKKILEDISDDETPIEQIKQMSISKQVLKPVETPKPQTIFTKYKFV